MGSLFLRELIIRVHIVLIDGVSWFVSYGLIALFSGIWENGRLRGKWK